MKKILWFIVVLLVLVIGYLLLNRGAEREASTPVVITSYEECIAAGYPSQESYPARCTTPEGETFTQDIGNALEKQDLIVADSPHPGDTVSSPVSISGEARGYWFFEASFPVEIRDANGQLLGQWYAEAQGEWMTEDFVPFTSTLTFETPATPTGTLILRRDNPSGLPENDDELTIPVRFEN